MAQEENNSIAEGAKRPDRSWVEFRNCTIEDADLFFPSKAEGGATVGGAEKMAKAICDNCVVKEDCLNYSIENDQKFGTWGGMTEAERRRYRKTWEVDKRKQELNERLNDL